MSVCLSIVSSTHLGLNAQSRLWNLVTATSRAKMVPKPVLQSEKHACLFGVARV